MKKLIMSIIVACAIAGCGNHVTATSQSLVEAQPQPATGLAENEMYNLGYRSFAICIQGYVYIRTSTGVVPAQQQSSIITLLPCDKFIRTVPGN